MASDKRKKEQEELEQMRLEYYQLRNEKRGEQREQEEKQKRLYLRELLQRAEI